jgi:hypothetical protein
MIGYEEERVEQAETARLGYVYDDRGRAEAGYKGDAGDCVVRSIAIATGRPYKEVYDELSHRIKHGKQRKGRKPR